MNIMYYSVVWARMDDLYAGGSGMEALVPMVAWGRPGGAGKRRSYESERSL